MYNLIPIHIAFEKVSKKQLNTKVNKIKGNKPRVRRNIDFQNLLIKIIKIRLIITKIKISPLLGKKKTTVLYIRNIRKQIKSIISTFPPNNEQTHLLKIHSNQD